MFEEGGGEGVEVFLGMAMKALEGRGEFAADDGGGFYFGYFGKNVCDIQIKNERIVKCFHPKRPHGSVWFVT